jgi:hypothetical protein
MVTCGGWHWPVAPRVHRCGAQRSTTPLGTQLCTSALSPEDSWQCMASHSQNRHDRGALAWGCAHVARLPVSDWSAVQVGLSCWHHVNLTAGCIVQLDCLSTVAVSCRSCTAPAFCGVLCSSRVCAADQSYCSRCSPETACARFGATPQGEGPQCHLKCLPCIDATKDACKAVNLLCSHLWAGLWRVYTTPVQPALLPPNADQDATQLYPCQPPPAHSLATAPQRGRCHLLITGSILLLSQGHPGADPGAALKEAALHPLQRTLESPPRIH